MTSRFVPEHGVFFMIFFRKIALDLFWVLCADSFSGGAET